MKHNPFMYNKVTACSPFLDSILLGGVKTRLVYFVLTSFKLVNITTADKNFNEAALPRAIGIHQPMIAKIRIFGPIA